MSKFVVLAIVLIALIAFMAGPLARSEKAKKLKLIADRFGSRDQLNPENFYETYFAGQGYARETVLGIREVLEQILDSDLSFLSDSDDFSKNLSFFWDFDSMANVELVQALEERFKIRIDDSEAEATKTVRQLVELVHAKTTAAT